MVQVKLSTNTQRKTVTVDQNTTIRSILEENNIDYSRTPVYVDGAALQVGDMDKTLSECGITDRCMIAAIVKTDNA
jgi:hypothetical protein